MKLVKQNIIAVIFGYLVTTLMLFSIQVNGKQASTQGMLTAGIASYHQPQVMDVALNANVIDVSQCHIDLCLTAVDQDKLSFSGEAAKQDLSIGKVLVSNVTKITPLGLLKRIIAIEEYDDQIIVISTDASLSELYDHGHIKLVTQDIDWLNVQANQGMNQVTSNVGPEKLAQTSLVEEVTKGQILPDGDGYFRLVADGVFHGFYTRLVIKLKPRFEFEWQKNPGELTPHLFKILVNLSVKDVNLAGAIGYTNTIKLAKLELPPLMLWAGVPIVLKNSINLNLQGKIYAGDAINGEVLLSDGEITLGAEYRKHQGWQNLTEFTGDPEFKRPEKLSPTYHARLYFPLLTFESAPYGSKRLKFFTALSPINTINYEPQQKMISIDGFTRASIGIKAEFFGLKQEYAYLHEFAPYDVYQGHIDGLPWPNIPKEPEKNAPSDQFMDIQAHWAYHEMALFIDQGFFSGYHDGTFRPDNHVTRAELAAMLVAVFDPQPHPNCKERHFKDIAGHWAEQSILRLATACWIAGYNDGTYRPDNAISRVEMYAVLAAQSGLSTYSIADMYAGLTDGQQIPPWAVIAMAKVYSNKIMVNYPNYQEFSPQQLASRADVSAAIYRLLIWQGNFANSYQSPYLAQPTDENTENNRL